MARTLRTDPVDAAALRETHEFLGWTVWHDPSKLVGDRCVLQIRVDHRAHLGPIGFVMNQDELVRFARDVLREFDPTPEQEILDSLKRIESRLAERGSR